MDRQQSEKSQENKSEKKIKSQDREDGELDEDEFYEDYDAESQDKLPLEKCSESTETILPSNSKDILITDDGSLNNQDPVKVEKNIEAQLSVVKTETESTNKNAICEQIFSIQNVQPTCSKNDQLQMDSHRYDISAFEENYDNDDDEFCLDSKRLKIDEGEGRDQADHNQEFAHDDIKNIKIESVLETEINKDIVTKSKSLSEFADEAVEDKVSFSDSSIGSSNSATNVSSVSSCKGAVSPASTSASAILTTCAIQTLSQPHFDSNSNNIDTKTSSSVEIVSQPIITDSSISSNEEDKLKVPPLKIICSQSSGGLPYVKPTSLESGSEGQISSENAKGKSNKLTRSKVSASNSNVKGSSLPTASPRKTSTNLRSSPLTVPTPLQSSASSSVNEPLISTISNCADLSNESIEIAVARRKLRSHTRQNPGAVSPITLASVSNNCTNMISTEQINELIGGESSDLVTEQQSQNDGTTELINESVAENNQIGNSSTSAVGRKRKPRQVSQPAMHSNEESSQLSIAPLENSNQGTKLQISDSNLTVSIDANFTEAPISETTSQIVISNETTPVFLNSSNCIKKFIELKNEAVKKRESLMQIPKEIKLPKCFQEFRFFKKNYLIRSNIDICQLVPFNTPPNDMPDELKDLYIKQEQERYRLRIQHRVELEKLVINFEQEILRSFGRHFRSDQRIRPPLSFCDIINDEEVYSTTITSQTSAIIGKSDLSTNFETQSFEIPHSFDKKSELIFDEKMSSSFNEIKMKYINLRDIMIKRQLHESDSLQAIQKMDFKSKVRELTFKQKLAMTNNKNSNGSITSQPFQFHLNDYHVPIVSVNSKLDLFDTSFLEDQSYNMQYLPKASFSSQGVRNVEKDLISD